MKKNNKTEKKNSKIELFISYSRLDNAFAELLKLHLKSIGYTTWMDIDNIRPTERFDIAIKTAISSCSHFILIVSRNSMSSSFVEAEYRHANALRKVIIPIIYKNTRSAFLPLNVYQNINFSRDNVERCINALVNHLGNPGEPALTTGLEISNTGFDTQIRKLCEARNHSGEPVTTSDIMLELVKPPWNLLTPDQVLLLNTLIRENLSKYSR